MTVKQLSREMDLRELFNWFAFFDLHGNPDTRQEYYGAQLASLILTVVSQKGRQYKTSDFMLDEILETDDDRARKAEFELRAHLDALAERNNRDVE